MKEALLNFFSIKGRINRKKFNIPFLSYLAISQVFSGYLYMLTYGIDKRFQRGIPVYEHEISQVETLLVTSLALIIIGRLLFIPYTIKRLHDLNRSELFILIPIVNIIYLTAIGFYEVPENRIFILIGGMFNWYLVLFEGTRGPNQYGEDPLRPNKNAQDPSTPTPPTLIQ